MLKFIKVRESHLEQILKWRTQPEVTRYMFTDVEYDMDRQRAWFQRISADRTCRYWLISFQDRPIGLVSFNDIDERNRRCSWAYYIGESEYRLIGGMIAPYVYRYGFGRLKLRKITGEVMAGNENVRRMHRLQGCREVGFYRDHIYKYGAFHDVYLYEILDEDWERLQGRYQNCIAEFEEDVDDEPNGQSGETENLADGYFFDRRG